MSRDEKRATRLRAAAEPGYPPANAVDRSRRRFLVQLGAGAGGLGVLTALGLPRLAHGQSAEIDFSVLEAHPPSVPPPPPAMAAPPTAAAPPSAAAPPGPPAEPRQVAVSEPLEVVVENRALFVEPGYILLLQWERPVDELAAIAGLEGSTQAVADYLSQSITAMDELHHIERLHAHERALVALLGGRVAPATIAVLHLDHDCQRVCNPLGWTAPRHDAIPMPGVAPGPGYP
jgi:hypothetical protein